MRIFLEKLSVLKDKNNPMCVMLIIAGHILFAVFLSMIVLGLIYTISCHTHQNTQLTHQLNTMNVQLNQLSANEDVSTFKTSLSGINHNITSLKQSIDNTTKLVDTTKISSQLNLLKQDIGELKKLVAQNNGNKEFIDAKALPFQVISVDVIAEQPFVSIDYDHHITPLGIGDTLAGWQITEADYATSTVEFKNNQNQYVKVSLQGQAK